MYSKQKVGIRGEDVACRYLQENGFQVLERNYKTKYVEMDLVALKDDEVVFVEVRTKTGERFGSPEETIKKDKIRRLKRGAVGYAQRKNYEGQYRIDLICVVLNNQGEVERVTHYEDISQ
ncbi:MAG: YraN family protein [Candidatus Pacebacteria bacterium]|nr:YraN family protein [Candidatus Paceibacterota bacterium]